MKNKDADPEMPVAAIVLPLCCCSCGALGLAITYLVFVIMGLAGTSAEEARDMCPNSLIWEYLLTTLFVSTVYSWLENCKPKKKMKNTEADEETSPINLEAGQKEEAPTSTNGERCATAFLSAIQFSVTIGMVCWGYNEVYGRSCDSDDSDSDLDSTLLYTMAKIHFVIDCVLLGVFLLLFVFALLTIIFFKNIQTWLANAPKDDFVAMTLRNRL